MSSKKKYTILDLNNLKNKRIVCLTLDVEQDYGDLLDEPSYEGLKYIPKLLKFLKEKNIPLTCFVQGFLFEVHPAKIEQLVSLDVEFELHSYSHPGPKEMNTKLEIQRGKEAYRKFFGKNPLGYRSPLGVINGEDYEILASNGFRFDSSIFPSLRPGVFNNLGEPNKPFLINNTEIIEFPFTVFSSVVRVPIALSYIKLIGKSYLYLLRTFNLPTLIIFDFHLHDLFKLDSSDRIPLRKFSFIYRLIFRRIYQYDREGLIILDKLITILRERGYSFQKLRDVYEAVSK